MCKLQSVNTNYGTSVEVADIKKKYIENIIDAAAQCRQISEIILFGSALEERCNEKSDIDIAIISRQTINSLCKNKGFEKFVETVYSMDFKQDYDRLYFSSMEEIEQKKSDVPICRELADKGKVIYRRVR
jgi:predicted nucleotidyltransferase